MNTSTVHNSQNVEITYMSIDRWMDKDMVHVYNGTVLNHKKNEIMLFAATCMQVEIIILNKS